MAHLQQHAEVAASFAEGKTLFVTSCRLMCSQALATQAAQEAQQQLSQLKQAAAAGGGSVGMEGHLHCRSNCWRCLGTSEVELMLSGHAVLTERW